MLNKLVTSIILSTLFSLSSQAALIDRGNGMIYDSDQDLTWMQNPNGSGGNLNQATAWAAALTHGGYDDWRLASMDINTDGTIVDCSSASASACLDNELGYMYHQNSVTHATPGLFLTPQTNAFFWSSTITNDPNFSVLFNFTSGNAGVGPVTNSSVAWAVRDGDVAPVPVPAAFWLLSSALLTMIGKRRRAQV